MTNDQDQSKRSTAKDTRPSRFKIEKLEERIAPAKGGLPGPPDGNGGGKWQDDDDNCRYFPRC